MDNAPSTSNNEQPPPYDYSQQQQQQQQQQTSGKGPYPSGQAQGQVQGQGQGQQAFQPNMYPSTPMNSGPSGYAQPPQPGGYAQPPQPGGYAQPPQPGVQVAPQTFYGGPSMVVQQGAPQPIVIVQAGGLSGNCPNCRTGILRIGTPTWAIIMMVIMIFVCWPLAFIFCCFHERRCGSCTYRDSQTC